jgi:4-diphosphocytidyl-2-C-methyl-D-erythritol kinase
MLSFPNAKINLGLNVIAKRPDGYHNLETVMLPIPSYDVLEIVESPTGKDTLRCTGRGVDCPMEKNLVYKAVMGMRKQFEIPPVAIYLDKQTPDGAGLGGGSADAAFTLKLLNDLFKVGATDEQLAAIAAEIGADCPFFIYNTPTYCTGTGTELAPLSPTQFSLPEGLWIAIVKPKVSVPTRDAYAGLTPKAPEQPLLDLLQLPIEQWQGRVLNDFEPTVLAKYPEIARVKQQLQSCGAVYTSMSGSGSAVFCFFRGKPQLPEDKPFGEIDCYLLKKFS